MSKNPLQVGNKVFIRTVTFYYTGEIVELSEHDIVLDKAAWIADTGRFFDALKTGKLNEVEPYVGVVSISRAAYLDATLWEHALPQKQL